ncbi:MAG: peptidase [Flavobacteriaceae bacterium]|nr:MAG: peptidase [Flavobacteriaceae bacterium]
MKHITLLLAGLIFSCNSSQKTVKKSGEEDKETANATTYATTITQEELKEHLYIYASDEFEGRETGTPGQKKAAEYIKAAYEEMKIVAAKEDGDYFQNVPLEMSGLPTGSINIGDIEYSIGGDFVTFSASNGTHNIIYAGYGIDEDGYSDYAELDVKGKLVLVKFGEPKNTDGTYTLSGTDETSAWSNMSESYGKRSEAATDNGAVGILYYDEANFARYMKYYEFSLRNNRGRMTLKNANGNFASFIINGNIAKKLVADIEKDNNPKTIATPIVLNITSNNEQVSSENVVAYIEGSEKPNEYLIISSHLDHIGITGEGDINNGADDDGSGTVALLEIAEAFKKAKDEGNGPKRSVVFLHVTGEEKGLFGSQYYTDIEPIFPLSQTVANLNIDMIGRIDPKREGDRNYIYLIGSDKLSTDLHELSEEVNEKFMQIELDYTYNDENDPNRFYYRSDHYNFAKNNIPIIFYFNGTHADYHKPTDTPDKINYDLLENRTRLVFYTAWEVANRDQKVIVDKAIK